MFVKITNGQVDKYPYSIGEFKKSKPNMSFPKDVSTETLEANGIFIIQETAPPTIDKKTHTYSWTVSLIDGSWTQVWATKKLEQEAAEQNVRDYRDRLLTNSDWTQVADAPVDKTAWATYRQALRDVPSQEGFPWNVTWPTQPE